MTRGDKLSDESNLDPYLEHLLSKCHGPDCGSRSQLHEGGFRWQHPAQEKQEQRMVTKWNHGLQDPEDGLVVSQEVFSQGYVLLTLPFLQETLDMLVKPGFIPSCDIVNLGFLEREHIF